jgi:hypothetical protein
MSMIATWLDCRFDKDVGDKLFRPLQIGEILHQRELDPDLPAPPAPRHCLCLLFDLKKVDNTASDDDTAHSIEIYLTNTMEEFVVKYQAELGNMRFSAWERSSPGRMIARIFVRLLLPSGNFIIYIV